MVLFVISAIGFVENHHRGKICENIIVEFRNDNEHNFLIEDDVIADLTRGGNDPIIGGKLINIDLKSLEMSLKKNKFVDGAQIVKDLKGNVIVKVSHVRAIARVIRSDSSFYISDQGVKLPLSNRRSARVLLISGEGSNDIFKGSTLNSSLDSALFDVIKYINNDQFLKAQIAEIEIDEFKELTLYPQVTKQNVLFGDCENYVDKFERLEIAYKDILPRKGWNVYESINLKFKDQIICK